MYSFAFSTMRLKASGVKLDCGGASAIRAGAGRGGSGLSSSKATAARRARNRKPKARYTYGLHGTPTTFTLEERIATLEGGTYTMLVSSGLAAITLVDIALLKSGDHLVSASGVFAGGISS